MVKGNVRGRQEERGDSGGMKGVLEVCKLQR